MNFSIFISNSAIENLFNANDLGFGGALYCFAKRVYINCTYFLNNSKNKGGSIAVIFDNEINLNNIFIINNCWFISNTAYIGGALFLRGSSVFTFISEKCVYSFNWGINSLFFQ